MDSFRGDYFDGQSSVRHPVVVEVTGGYAQIRGEQVALNVALGELGVSPRMGNTPIRIALPAGGVIVTGEYERVAQLLGAAPEKSLAHRLESRPGIIVASLAGLVLAGWFIYVSAIPWAARVVAHNLPVAIESELSEETLESLDRMAFTRSTLTIARRERLESVFKQLAKTAGVEGARLEFRDGGWIGANAFAVPGAVVILTDQLVELLGDDEKVAAVLAHELGHVQHRHTSRFILQDSMVALLAMLVFGDVSSVATLAATVPTVLMHSGFSRDFEREADTFAFEVLKKTGRSPRLLGEALSGLEGEARRLKKLDTERARDVDRDLHEGPLRYLSTHPSTPERVRAAEEAERGPL